MKNLFVASCAMFVLSNPAFARSIDPTPIVASISGTEYGIARATVLEDGRFQIKSTDGTFQVTQLNKATLEEIVNAASALASTEIQVIDSEIICMMMPIASLDSLAIGEIDSATGSFKQLTQPHLVLNAQGCYNSHKVRPKNEYILQSAQSLLAQLRILALSFKSDSAQ